MELKGITKCRADMGDYLDKKEIQDLIIEQSEEAIDNVGKNVIETEDSSLYSNDMQTLIRFNGDEDKDEIELNERIQIISPNSIRFNNRVRKLTIPEGVHELKANSICGDIDEIVFLGALKKIEKDSLCHIYNHFANCTIRINGTLSDIDDDGKEELRKWIENPMLRSKNEVIFAAPKPCGRGDIGNGFIELSEVIDIKDKMLLGKDTRPILINADINEGTVIKEEEKTDISNVPIIIRPEVTSKEETYNSVDITRITFATNNEMNIRVLEKIDVVEKLIKQSYKKNTIK